MNTYIYSNKNLKKAFTLLEMLIVLGIIGIIITIAAVSYSSSQRKSRDARRKSDLKTIQSAYEQYYALCGYQYPGVTPGVAILSYPLYCPDPTTVFLPTPPVDPKGGTPYILPTGGTNSLAGYKVCATMEMDQIAQYCVTNQQ